jgi:DNA polymerase
MGPGKFQSTAAGYNVMLDASTCEEMVQAWREANPAIVQFWWACERAMHQVCHASPGSTVSVRGVTFVRQKGAVLTRLPSGRHLVYRQPSIQWNPDNRRNQFTYMGSGGGGWSLQRAWPGKMVENIVQAVARDALADHMVELGRLGLPLVATVHDELIAEVAEHEADGAYDAMRKVMKAPPVWAVDLPMDAAGFIASRYRKA